MSTIFISWKGYAVTPWAESFLKNYLERVRRYVNSNGISSEYAQDIENRLAEKLAYVGVECAEPDAVRIVNELWEPEDVFADAPKTKGSGFGDVASAVKDNMKSPLYRDSSKGMLFGVCAGLGVKFDVDPFFIRLLFVFLFFFYGTGVVAYLALAILMKDRVKIENPEAFAEKRLRDGVSAATDAIASVPLKTVEAVRGWVNFTLAVLTFLFFGFIAVVLFFVSLGFFAAFWASVSGIVIENQNVFGGAHRSLPFAAWAAWASLFVLSWIAGFKAFWKKISNAAVLAIAGLVLAGSVGAGAYGTFQTIANFANRESLETVFEANASTGSVTVEFAGANKHSPETIELPKWTEVRMTRSEDAKLRIRAITEVSAKDSETAKSAFAKIVPVGFSEVGTSITLRDVEIAYGEKGDYAFAKRVIEISAPDAVRVKITKFPRSTGLEGVTRTEFDSYASYDGRCTGTEMKYVPELGAFVCDSLGYPESVVNQAKVTYLERTAYEIAPENYGDSGRTDGIPYRYDDSIRVRSLSWGLYEVTYGLTYQHPEGVANSIAKTYRVDVSPLGDVSHEEVAKTQ